jgi:iron complex outermembrane receptor protein
MPIMLWAQNSIEGKIVNSETQKPLVGATVTIKNSAFRTSSSVDGSFTISGLKSGNYVLSVSYVGFKTLETRITTDKQFYQIALQSSVLLSDEVIVSATRAGENAATTLKNLKKIDIEKNNFGQDLPYLLNQTPSVVVFSDAGAGVGYTGLRIRGSDATRINVTINGIPYNDTESQGTYWVDLPDFASSVDNIQIQRGVGTSTNGAGAFGASLNIQTTTRQDTAYAELDNSAGSYQTLKNTLKLGTGLINGKWSFDGRLSRIVSDGYIDRAASNLKSYFLSGAYYGKNSLLRLNVFSGKEKTYQAWGGVPQDSLVTNRRYNAFTYDNQTDNYQQDHYQLLYSLAITPQINFNGALHYTKGAGYYEEYQDNQAFADYNLKPVTIGNNSIDSTNLISRKWLNNAFYGTTYSFNYKPTNQLNFTLGGAYNRYKGEHYTEVIWAAFEGENKIGQRSGDNNGFKTDFNVFGKAQYQINNVSLFADLQYRVITYQFLGFNNYLQNVTQKDNLQFFNPKIGLTYNLNPNNNFYASFSVANKEPNRDDYTQSTPESRPKAERLNNIEAGYRFKSENITGGINFYSMIYKNQLVLTGQINDVGSYIRANVGNSYRNGIELDAKIKILPSLSWLLTAAASENKIKNFNYDSVGHKQTNYTKTDIAFSPNFVGSSTIAFKVSKNTEIALLSKYVSDQFLDNTSDQKRKLDAFFVNDVRVHYDLKFKGFKNIGLGLQVNNIFDELYSSNGYFDGIQNYYFPQAETNFLVSLNVKF